MPPQRTPIEIRFIRKITFADDGCWLWTGSINENGYPLLWNADTQLNMRAHRFAYWLAKGDIPKGLDLDHLCRVRHCVNPDHLEAVTRSENLKRSPLIAIAARKRAETRREQMREIGRQGGRAIRREDSTPDGEKVF